jgi:hypothetical protein
MGKYIAIGVGVLVLLILCIFGMGYLNAGYNNTAGVAVSSSQTNMFQQSQAYTQGMAQELAKENLELAQTKDPEARAAIIEYIQETFSSYDSNKINNPQLRLFLVNVMAGNIQ